MFDHPIVDVALGLIFFFLVMSLLVSAVQEWISSFLGLRSSNLHTGVERLLGSPLAKQVYEHPIIKNLAKDRQRPSYIEPETLSAVVLEVISQQKLGKSYVSLTQHEVSNLVANIPNDDLKQVASAFVVNTTEAANELKEAMADWFDQGMDRISGWYKRRIKKILIVIAAFATITTNASAIHMVEELWKNDALRVEITAQAMVAVNIENAVTLMEPNFDSLKILPIGWETKDLSGMAKEISDNGIWKTVLGWIITVAAISLGAPFWFDLLGKVAQLKGVGGKRQKPGETK